MDVHLRWIWVIFTFDRWVCRAEATVNWMPFIALWCRWTSLIHLLSVHIFIAVVAHEIAISEIIFWEAHHGTSQRIISVIHHGCEIANIFSEIQFRWRKRIIERDEVNSINSTECIKNWFFFTRLDVYETIRYNSCQHFDIAKTSP